MCQFGDWHTKVPQTPPMPYNIRTQSKGGGWVTTPNWIHHSKKNKNNKGTCKGQLKARKQALQALKLKLNFK